MAIQDRNLAPGTQLVATYKKQQYHAEVVEGEEKKLKYRLEDGREFKSPSATGSAITGKACNGWSFWSIDLGQVEEAVPQGSPDQQETEGVALQPMGVGFRRVPNQRGVLEGEVRLYCDTCRESFTVPAGQQPDTCPQGHRPGDTASEEETQS